MKEGFTYSEGGFGDFGGGRPGSMGSGFGGDRPDGDFSGERPDGTPPSGFDGSKPNGAPPAGFSGGRVLYFGDQNRFFSVSLSKKCISSGRKE